MRTSILCLLLLTACGDERALDDADADAGSGDALVDSASPPLLDGGFLDVGDDANPTDAGEVVPNREGVWLTDQRGGEGSDPGFGGLASTCFDGRDNDQAASDTPDGIDCADLDCQPLPSCCVDDADCIAPPELVFATDFRECTDSFCGGSFGAFGAPSAPVFDGDTLAMMGDQEYDSGWLAPEPLDLGAERIEVVLDFKYGACTDCLETAAVGLTRQTAMTDQSHVQPVVAVVAIARAEPSLQIHVEGVVVGEFTLPADASRWTLTVRPDGRLDVRGPDGVGLSTSFDASGLAHLILYGHSENPDAVFVDGMRLDGLEVSRAQVDRHAAWRHRTVEPWTTETQTTEHLSVIREGEHDVVLVENETHLLEFFTRSESEWTLSNWHLAGWESAHDYAFARLGGVVHIIAIDDSGDLLMAPLTGDAFESPTVILDQAAQETLGWSSIAEPSMVEFGSTRILVARTAAGITLATLDVDTETWTPIATNLDLHSSARHPSLLIHNNVYWLHLAERRGTRWRIRALVSDQLVAWRALGTTLGGSLVDDAFDRFGASHPAVVAEDQSLRLYYLGHDNITERLGSASRQSPIVGRR